VRAAPLSRRCEGARDEHHDRHIDHDCQQVEAVRRVGVTRQTIIAIEQGRYSPSLEMAFRIARDFRVPLDEAFVYSDEQG